MSRLYDPTEGQILIDGHDVRSLDPKWLRSVLMGVVPQGGSLMAGSVLENVTLGRDDVTLDMVDQALRQTGCTPFLDSLEQVPLSCKTSMRRRLGPINQSIVV